MANANIIDIIAPYLAGAGEFLVNLDADKTGADDFAGELLRFGAEAIAAIHEGADLPEIPEILKKGTADKLSPIVRGSLLGITSLLMIAIMQTKGKVQLVLKYVKQALNSLLSGSTIPPMPVALTTALTAK